MKRFSLAVASLALGISSFAQIAPNRVIINDTQGNRLSSHVAEFLGDITFARIDGEVLAEIEIKDVTEEGISVNVFKTDDCKKFKLDIMPAGLAHQYPEDMLIRTVDSSTSTVYYDDFDKGFISADQLSLTPGGEYSIITVGFDELDTPAGLCIEDFTAYQPPVVGNPVVKASLVSNSLTGFTVAFEPSADVSTYSCVAMEKGQLQFQWENYGPAFGFASIGQMIYSWGSPRVGNDQIEWTGMDPNTEYEVWIQPLDQNGTFADLICFSCSTLSQGGSGEATVDIKLGNYVYTDWNGQMLPSQFITFTPGAETWRYRFGVYTAEIYDSQKADVEADLLSEPPVPNMANWYFFETLTTDFQINPNTEFVVVAAGMNADGKWGAINTQRYTTPAQASSSAGAVKSVRAPKPSVIPALPGSGRMPSFRPAQPMLRQAAPVVKGF